MLWECKEGCQLDRPKSKGHPGECKKHGRHYVYTKDLKRTTDLRQVSQTSERGGRRGSTLKRGRGLSASPAQQKKVRDLPCIHCGRDRHEGVEIQAMHVYPRRFATCECAEGVVPGCAECHPAYEAKKIDLLPLLLDRGYRAELVHAMVEHEASPLHVIEVVTGVVWKPVAEVEESAYVPDEDGAVVV